MKKCKIMLVLMLTICLCLSGCGQKNDESVKPKEEVQKEEPNKTAAKETAMYEIKSETFKDKKTNIAYPQIVNLADTTAQDKINKIIKENAFKSYNEILKQGEGFTYELKYDVMYQNPDLLSIRYNDYTSFDQAAHPSNSIQTLNINIKNQEIIKLGDMVNINEGFVNLFKNAKYKSQYEEQTPELMESVENQLNEHDTKGWIDVFKNADTYDIYNESSYSYFTKDSLVIVISVPHFMGDYAEFEISYKDLTDYKKADNEIWKAFESK